jgi:hypothetical protein
VSPYRDAAEDVEAGLDALEVEGFKAMLARRGRLVRIGVSLTVLAAVAAFAGVLVFAHLARCSVVRTPEPRRETHMMAAAGGAFPMTDRDARPRDQRANGAQGRVPPPSVRRTALGSSLPPYSAESLLRSILRGASS